MTTVELTPWMDSIDPRQFQIAGTALATLALGWILSLSLHRFGFTTRKLHRELMPRLRTWTIIIPATVIPILLGPVAIAVALFILGFACFREFSRAVNLTGDLLLLGSVVIGLAIVAIAIATHQYTLLLLSAPLVAVLTAAASVFRDQPAGYLKRIAIANLGFMLCGLWPGHLGFLGNNSSNATVLLWFILCIELNDVFAFLSGRLFGRVPLCPRTSPGKTRGGLIGSVILTTAFVAISGSALFSGQTLGHLLILLPLGLLISISGTIGDLILSSIKRDLQLKDLAQTLPGHGGMLDRCDSLIFAAPVAALMLGLIEMLPAFQSLAPQLP